MGEPARKQTLPYADYLAREQTSDIKHEFYGGEIFAMSGGTFAHGHLAARCISLLDRTLGGPCRVGSSDVRIFVPDANEACYPDASIICGSPQHDLRDRDAVTNPAAVVEVLSPSSESWDRGGKFARYQRLPSLRDYVLVSVERNRVEHFARNDDGSWTYRDLGDGDVLRLTGAVAEVAVAELYADIEDLRGEADAGPPGRPVG